MRIVLVAGLVGCGAGIVEPDPPAHPCAAAGEHLDVAPPHGEFGEMVDGGTLWCGNPPQGGAPYSPFRLRILGDEAFKDGVLVEMSAVDVEDGSDLAFTSLTMEVFCGNVGDGAGMWAGSEAHMRYDGFGLDELDGRTAEVTVRASATADPTIAVESSVEVELVLE